MRLFVGEIYPEVLIHEEEQHHISKVLRMRAGEEITVTDGKGHAAKGKIAFEGKKTVMNEVEILPESLAFSPKLHIAIAPTKMIDRIEFFVEKATEMGISEITFLNTEKTERRNINLEKLRKQAVAASKQSLRFHFPIINEMIKLSDFLGTVTSEKTFVAHCDVSFERKQLEEIPKMEETIVLIGPEGDFSPKEINLMSEMGIKAVSLGKQRLRTETAGIFIAAWNYARM